MQKYTSRNTSVNSRKVPAVFRNLMQDTTPRVIFDYGCGKYIDHPYDPFSQPGDVNERGVRFLAHAINSGITMDIVCASVLNVIDDVDVVSGICDLFTMLHRISGCGVYIFISEGDRSGIGKQTGKDQYQRNELTRSYQRFLPGSSIHGNTITIERCSHERPKPN